MIFYISSLSHPETSVRSGNTYRKKEQGFNSICATTILTFLPPYGGAHGAHLQHLIALLYAFLTCKKILNMTVVHQKMHHLNLGYPLTHQETSDSATFCVMRAASHAVSYFLLEQSQYFQKDLN